MAAVIAVHGMDERCDGAVWMTGTRTTEDWTQISRTGRVCKRDGYGKHKHNNGCLTFKPILVQDDKKILPCKQEPTPISLR